jgi:endonuclease/exonuclease/phosphatase family metal-dependent hydrolase
MPFALATYNVKNLFDAESDADRPAWNRKLDALAEAIRACNADVVGLQEVGSLESARALVARLRPEQYGEPFLGTADARGIRCALIARRPLAFADVRTCSALPFPTFHAGDPAPFGARIPLRRGIVHVGIDMPGSGLLHVLVAHFKSPRPLGVKDAQGEEVAPASAYERAQDFVRTMVWRVAEALFTRSLVDAILTREPSAQVAVLGDLNDVPSSAALRALQSEGPGALLDCTASIEPACRFSIVHESRPFQVDHILATPSLGARLRGARLLNASLRDHGPTAATMPEAMTPDSDHAPLVAYFD